MFSIIFGLAMRIGAYSTVLFWNYFFLCSFKTIFFKSIIYFQMKIWYWSCNILLDWETTCNKKNNHIALDSPVHKELACNAGDPGSITRSGRSTGEGIGYPLQYSGLENSMDSIVHGVTKNWTRLSDFHFLSLIFEIIFYQGKSNK